MSVKSLRKIQFERTDRTKEDWTQTATGTLIPPFDWDNSFNEKEENPKKIKCQHCGQYGFEKSECLHCGAPIDDEEI